MTNKQRKPSQKLRDEIQWADSCLIKNEKLKESLLPHLFCTAIKISCQSGKSIKFGIMDEDQIRGA
jgi:hypothetical protein